MPDMTATSGLIQMTAHTLTTPAAQRWIIVGALFAALGAFLVLCVALSARQDHKLRYLFIFTAVTVCGVIMLTHGTRMPRVKEIKCCASGPISLEEVAARYDIIEVDGKLLTLRER